jgi:hypothetical protein
VAIAGTAGRKAKKGRTRRFSLNAIRLGRVSIFASHSRSRRAAWKKNLKPFLNVTRGVPKQSKPNVNLNSGGAMHGGTPAPPRHSPCNEPGKRPPATAGCADMRHVKTLHLYRYWAALKGARPTPALAEFQPAILRSLMADAFTLRGETHAFGYAGSRLRATLQQPLDERAFERLWPDADRRHIRRLLAAVVDNGLPVILRFRLDWPPPGQRTLTAEGEALLVPASDGAGGAPAVMGSFALFDGSASRDGRPALSLLSASFPSRTIAVPDADAAPERAVAPARSWPLRLVGATRHGF